MWCLSSVPLLRGYLSLVKDAEARQMMEEVIDHFVTTVAPVIGDLRKGNQSNSRVTMDTSLS